MRLTIPPLASDKLQRTHTQLKQTPESSKTSLFQAHLRLKDQGSTAKLDCCCWEPHTTTTMTMMMMEAITDTTTTTFGTPGCKLEQQPLGAVGTQHLPPLASEHNSHPDIRIASIKNLIIQITNLQRDRGKLLGHHTLSHMRRCCPLKTTPTHNTNT